MERGVFHIATRPKGLALRELGALVLTAHWASGEPAFSIRRPHPLRSLVLLALLGTIAIGMSGAIYLISALALGGVFLYWAVLLYVGNNPRAAMATFKYSILYLGLLFVALLVDHYFMITLTPSGAALDISPV